MPLTRSQQESAASSGSGQEIPEWLTPAEVEIVHKEFKTREKKMEERAEALFQKQEELEKLRQSIEQEQANQPVDTDWKEKMERMERTLNNLTTLPGQLESLYRQVADMQISPGRDTPNHHYLEERKQHLEQSPIRLKDAIDSIPRYDGHKMSVFQFCKMCERAANLIPRYHEYHLVQLITNKLYGHAYAAVEGTEYPSVFSLTKRLKQVFGPNKSTDQYRGELANIYMKPNEHILDYVERVRELQTSIMDGETTSAGFIGEVTQSSIEFSARDSFINGLPPDLLVRVKLEGPSTLDQAVVCAIQFTKTLEAENLRRRPTAYRPPALFRADVPTNLRNATSNPPRGTSEQPTNVSRSAPFIKPLIPGLPGPNYPDRVCFYCKAPGHFMRSCPKMIYKNRNAEGNPGISNQGNASRVPVTGVHRDATQVERPSTNILTIQETTDRPLHTSPN